MHTTTGTFHQYDVPIWMWGVLAGVLALYGVIEWFHNRRDHQIGMKEAVNWSIFYVALGVAFGVLVYRVLGGQAAGEYYAAYFIEKALSLDNLFVIGLIMTSFQVSKSIERRMLDYGILGAIVLRAVFIMGGLGLLHLSKWVSIVFGLIVLNGAWKALKEALGSDDIEEEVKQTDRWIWRMIQRYLPFHPEFDGHKMITIIDGTRRVFTLMLPVILLIEFSDIMFAFDSVPAVLSVSPDRYVAYSSNLFAILGLRALFFVFQALADRFWALSWGLTGVLGWIAVKMIGSPFGLHISIPVSLIVLGIMLGGSVVVSMLWPKKKEIPDIDIDGDGMPGVSHEKELVKQ